MCVKTLPIIQDEASSSAPREFADVAPDNSIPEINKIHKNKTSLIHTYVFSLAENSNPYFAIQLPFKLKKVKNWQTSCMQQFLFV